LYTEFFFTDMTSRFFIRPLFFQLLAPIPMNKALKKWFLADAFPLLSYQAEPVLGGSVREDGPCRHITDDDQAVLPMDEP
jgi:hypothetical protein